MRFPLRNKEINKCAARGHCGNFTVRERATNTSQYLSFNKKRNDRRSVCRRGQSWV